MKWEMIVMSTNDKKIFEFRITFVFLSMSGELDKLMKHIIVSLQKFQKIVHCKGIFQWIKQTLSLRKS
jgi:hypothetical protein